MKYKKLSFIILFAISVAYNFPIIKTSLNPYDEGIILTGAERILKSHIPYLDFWSMYPPGQFYALAFLFKIFGISVLVERIYDIIIKSCISLMSFLITQKLGFSNRVSLINWAMSVVWIYYSGFPAYPVYPAILFIFISLYFFYNYTESNRTHWIIYSGLFLTLGAMFRHDLSGMAAIAFLITLLLRKLMGAERSWHPMLLYIFTMFLVGVPISIYLIKYVGIQPIFNQLIQTPADIMPKYRSLPYPSFISFTTLRFYAFPLVLLIGLFTSLVLIIKHKTHSMLSYNLFILSVIGILFINQVRVRADSIHLLPVVLVSIIIIPVLFSFAQSWLKEMVPKAKSGTVLIFLIILGSIFIRPIYAKVKMFNSDYLVKPNRSAICRAGYSSMSDDLRDLVLYVRNHKQENIYVGVKNHDQFIVNEVIIYFLVPSNYPTKYNELHPGVTTTPEKQREIIDELKKSSVKTVVLTPSYWFERNQTAFDTKINLLDDYISENYEVIKKFGTYEVWISKG